MSRVDDDFLAILSNTGLANMPASPDDAEGFTPAGGAPMPGILSPRGNEVAESAFDPMLTAADTATFGGLPLMGGLQQGALDVLKKGKFSAFDEGYSRGKQILKERLAEAREKSPYLSAAGDVVGAVAPAIALTPAIAAEGAGLLTKAGQMLYRGGSGEATNALSRVGMATRGGAAQGALHGAVTGEGDATDRLFNILKDAGMGAGFGAAAGGAFEGVGGAARAIAGKAGMGDDVMKNLPKPVLNAIKEFSQDVQPEDLKMAQQMVEVGRQNGIELTTGEALNNVMLQKALGSRMRDPRTTNMVSDTMKQRGQQFVQAQDQAIGKVMGAEGANLDEGGKLLVGAADDFIKNLRTQRSKDADPFYKEAFFKGGAPRKVVPNAIDPEMAAYIQQVKAMNSDLAKLPDNALQLIDRARGLILSDKRTLDKAIQMGTADSRATQTSRELGVKAEKIDALIKGNLGAKSPARAALEKARSIYAEGSHTIEQELDSVSGYLKDLSGMKAPEAGSKLFNQTTNQQFKETVSKVGADTSRKAVGSAMRQDLMDKTGEKAGKTARSMYYDTLSDKEKMDYLLQNVPEAQRLKDVFGLSSRIESQRGHLTGGSNTMDKAAMDAGEEIASRGGNLVNAAGNMQSGNMISAVKNFGRAFLPEVFGKRNMTTLEAKQLTDSLMNAPKGLDIIERIVNNRASPEDIAFLQKMVGVYPAAGRVAQTQATRNEER